jgi:hypothetical protein
MVLRQVFRQLDSGQYPQLGMSFTSLAHTIPAFSQMLNAIRLGLLTLQIVDALRQLERPLEDGPVAGTTLCEHALKGTCSCLFNHDRFPIKAQAEKHNEDMLKELSGPMEMYHAMDSRGFDSRKKEIPEDLAKRLLRQLTVPPALKLKVRSLVLTALG